MDQQPHSESQGGQFWCQFKWPNTILSPIKLSLISYHTVYAVYFNTKCSSLTNFYSLKILLLSWEIDIPDIPFIFLILLSLYCKDCTILKRKYDLCMSLSIITSFQHPQNMYSIIGMPFKGFPTASYLHILKELTMIFFLKFLEKG